jgi:hypothetical protein
MTPKNASLRLRGAPGVLPLSGLATLPQSRLAFHLKRCRRSSFQEHDDL